MRLPRSRLVARIAIGTWLVYAVWLVERWGDQATRHTLSDVVFIGFAMLGIAAAAVRARSGWGCQSTGWASVTVGLTGWLLADAFKTFYPLVTGTLAPWPSVADAGYLMLPVCVCLTLLLAAATNARRQSPLRLFLDGFIVAGAVLIVSWVVILRDLFELGRTSTFAFLIMVAYPIVDVAVVTVGLVVLAWAQLPWRTSAVLLWAGIVAMAASNDAYFHLLSRGGYARGGLLDIGTAASLLAFALAALYSRRMPDPDFTKATPLPKAVLWLPYVPLVLANFAVAPALPHPDALVVVVGIAVVGAVLIRQFLMVGENHRLLAVVAEQAVRDPLTGLANRTLFNDRLSHAVALRRRDARPLAVLSIDLDHFKLVNDRLGHAAGDAVLVQVAERIQRCLRVGDTVARLGGDEFAVLLEDGEVRAGLVAQRVTELFDEPFVIDDRLLFIGLSVGLAVAQDDTTDTSAQTLLKQSDAAMYAAKRARSSYARPLAAKVALTDRDDVDLASRSAEDSQQPLLDRLRHAIDHDELELVYQPKVSLGTGEVVGVEALVRWPHPDRGLLEPVEFLPLIRSNGLMDALTGFVLARALSDAAHWYSVGHAVPVAVNVSAPSFADADLPSRVWQALRASGLPADCLTLEITEDQVLRDPHATRIVLHSLRERGTRVSIDDFGSGYSALNYLRRFPIDEVKLDRQFVLPILDDAKALAIVGAVIDLVHALDMIVVAEGVEDDATARRLQELGCDIAQGYHYSAPVACTALLEMLGPSTTDFTDRSSRLILPVAR